MLGRTIRWRANRAFAGLLWIGLAVYTLLAVSLLDLTRNEPEPASCLDPVGGSTAVPHEWRWWPVGWECDFTAQGAGVLPPNWRLTVALGLVPVGLLVLLVTGRLARRAQE